MLVRTAVIFSHIYFYISWKTNLLFKSSIQEHEHVRKDYIIKPVVYIFYKLCLANWNTISHLYLLFTTLLWTFINTIFVLWFILYHFEYYKCMFKNLMYISYGLLMSESNLYNLINICRLWYHVWSVFWNEKFKFNSFEDFQVSFNSIDGDIKQYQ